jgi:hypothetical protein
MLDRSRRRLRFMLVGLICSIGPVAFCVGKTAAGEGDSGATIAGPSFFHDVIPALAKQGCSAGACHGSPSGKNGFRLSLRGYDPQSDGLSIVQDELGRRVDLLSPESSLMLLKPMMRVAHGGGRQLSQSDPAYEILRQWVAQGCSLELPASPCTDIRIGNGSELQLSPEAEHQQLSVQAIFADGTERDVSSLTVFSSSDISVATVTQQGLVTGVGRGQAAISAKYLEHWKSVYVTFAPPAQAVEDETRLVEQAAEWRPLNEIDELIDRQLKVLQFAPAGLCTDETFVRRVYLDLIGLLPTITEVEEFVDNLDTRKREKLIDALLERPEYGHFWALKWGDLLRLNKQQVSAAGVHKFNRWLVQAMSENMPYDQFAEALLLSAGSTFENPAANYYRTATDVSDAAETSAQIFLGARLECCKCHNHPFEKWTQDNYYGFAAFFNRVQRKSTRRTDELVIWSADEGEVVQPRTKQVMQPWLPGIGGVADSQGVDRREALVEWLTSPDNELFAAVEVNRIWSHLMGRGIVHPIDDFRASNPPSNPRLLESLATDFREHGFDRKHILRQILNSRTYQASSVPATDNVDDGRYFSYYQPRLLTAEQLFDAIGSFTGQIDSFAGLPAGTRATQLPSPDVNLEFLEVFGQPKRETPCQCERVTEVNLSQALQIANGQLVHDKLISPEGRLQKLLQTELTQEQRVTELFLAAYARRPVAREIESAKAHFAKQPQPDLALQDLAWALINSNEFLMQR